MSHPKVVIRGEAYLAIDTIAECFEVETTWVEAVYRRGLLGAGEERDKVTYVEAGMLDRVAEIQRFYLLLDRDLNAVVLFFEAVG